MKTPLLILLLAMGLGCSSAFTQGMLLGNWQGLITQDPSGLDSIYLFSLTIESEGEEIRGYSMIQMRNQPEYFGKLSFSGKVVNGKLILHEQEVVEEHLFGFAYWCIKDLHLVLLEEDGKVILQGHWESGMCSWSTGTIYLERSLS